MVNGSKSWANNLNDLREKWKIRREEPIEFVVPVKLFKQDIKKLSRDEILQLNIELRTLHIKAKKTIYKTYYQNKNKNETARISQDEHNDLFYTKISIGAHFREIDHALSKINRNNIELTNHHFVDVCKEKLPKETWQEIMKIAIERVKHT